MEMGTGPLPLTYRLEMQPRPAPELLKNMSFASQLISVDCGLATLGEGRGGVKEAASPSHHREADKDV